MALLSALQVSFDREEELSGKELGFLAYGSGSKSKVFSGKINENWKSVVEKWQLFETLGNRKVVDFSTYEKLHRKQLKTSVNSNYKGFGLVEIERENPLSYGARKYQFKS